MIYKNALLTIWAFTALTLTVATPAQNTIPTESLADFCKNLPRPAYQTLERIDHPSTWFELYQVAPGVTAIYEPYQWQEVISYLIQGDQQALLFDTGNGIEDISTIVDSLTDLPIIVLNSHTHYDHVGGNYAFTNILGLDTPFTRTKQQGRSNTDINIEVSSQALCKVPPSGTNESNHVGRPFKVTNWIKAGHHIELGNRSLEVVSIPGHTPDSIALHDRDNKLLFTGDTFYAGPIWLYEPETNLDQYRESIQALIDLDDVNTLLPAHNTPLVNASILPQVLIAFDDLMAGKLSKTLEWEGTVSYKPLNQTSFSFLMRDEPLPYSKNK